MRTGNRSRRAERSPALDAGCPARGRGRGRRPGWARLAFGSWALFTVLAVVAGCGGDGPRSEDVRDAREPVADTGRDVGGGVDVNVPPDLVALDSGSRDTALRDARDVPGPRTPEILAEPQVADPADEVVVAHVFVPAPSWVAIHIDVRGQPGEVVGQTALAAGEHTDVLVRLSRGANPGEYFWAILHEDLGEVGVFEYPGVDEPWLDPEGEPVHDVFDVVVPNPIITPELQVVDQDLDFPTMVVIPVAASRGPGWVVVHADDAGAPGAILGKTRLINGFWRDVPVTLARPAGDGERLWAVLHVDEGTVGEFEFPGPDAVVTDADGDPLQGSFVVTPPPLEPLVSAVNQVADPADEVVVARVVASDSAWLAVRADDAGAPGAVLGHVAVAAGATDEVVVALDRPATDGERLWAVLHADAGLPGAWEFPGPDEPLRDGEGALVADSFLVAVGSGPVPDVVADDQTPSPADQVVVASVVAAEAGWVVVYEDAAGLPGAALGHAAVPVGTSHGVAVALDREAVDGETLWAVLHVDAGTVGVLELPEPDVPAVAGGELVRDDFVVTVVTIAQPYILAADQVVDPVDVVFVAEVWSDGPGFVVVRDDDGGTPGPVLGHTAVPGGLSTGVSVTLGRNLEDGETLWAVLHVDEGTAGAFEYPGPDAAATDAGGNVISDAFVVTVAGMVVDPELVVADQLADPPDRVTIAVVASPVAGWLVVQEDAGGTPGAVVGFEAVLPGRTSNLIVNLDREGTNGETLWATLHVDAGTAGLFEVPGPDVPATDDAGAPVRGSFVLEVATVEPFVVVFDQTADPADRVVVTEALSDGRGWIAVHEDAGGAPGAVLGYASLAEGLNLDVAVDLARDAVDGETLYAMLHTDAGLVGTWEFPGPDAPVANSDGDVVAPSFVVTVPAPPTDPYLVVRDQSAQPADEVFVDEVWSPGPGWVVVREDSGGAPGAVLGQTAVAAGRTRGVYVTLSRDVVDGETLHAGLHVDAGDVGSFQFPGPDVPAVDGAGAPVSMAFVASLPPVTGAYVLASDQVADPADQVSIAEVWSDGQGWIVVHEDDGGLPGAVLGFAVAFDGLNRDLVVSLDRDAVDGETLWAVLHVDAGTAYAFEFPGPDGVATDALGDPVRAAFVVSLAAVGPGNAIGAESQTLTALSTVISVAEARAAAPSWVVVREDSFGFPGEVLGYTAVGAGAAFDVPVELARPAADGETLHALLHVDAGTPGVFEYPGDDAEALDDFGGTPLASFVTTVPVGTPAVRFTLGASGTSAYVVSGVAPARFSDRVTTPGGDDPTLTLSAGWRYEVVNTAAASHPFELVQLGATDAADAVLLSQSGAGSREADAAVAWLESGPTLRFTLSAALAQVLDGYRCAVHPSSMRGNVVVIP